MKPIHEPRDDVYPCPTDRPADELHYSLARVSRYRYLILEYTGGKDFIHWTVVSEPLVYDVARDRLKTLVGKRKSGERNKGRADQLS